MGISIRVSIVIGVKSGELVKEEITDDTFEVHDERGRPTGTFKTKSYKTIYLVNQPKKKIKDEGYINSITDILDIEEYPSVGDFGFHNGDYDSIDYLESGIVGVAIHRSTNLMYGGGTDEISLEEIMELKNKVCVEIHKRYGVNIEPKVYLISSVD